MKALIRNMFDQKDINICFFLLLFHLLLLFVHLSLASLQTFIHLQLNHDIATIETWLHANAWLSLGLVKCISIITFFKFLDATASIDLYKIKNWIKNFIFDRELLVLMFFIHLSLIFMQPLMVNDVFSVVDISWLALLFGSFLFYFTDMFLFQKVLQRYNVSPHNLKRGVVVWFLILQCASVSLLIPFHKGVNVQGVLHVFLILSLLIYSKSFMSSFLMYFMLIILPTSLIYPLDIVFSDEISIFKYQTPINPSLTVTIWLVSIIYYIVIKKRRWID
jgi:hypothetical protein